MRKLLLGTTAIAAAAIFAPGADAQSLSGTPFGTPSQALTSMRGLEVRLGGFMKAYYANTRQSTPSIFAGTTGNQLATSDFDQEIEIHVLATGKAANGLQYGVALEIENDGARTGGTNQLNNTLNYDEAWAYLAGPWGQLRFGDEDGAIQQLASGFITAAGVGGYDSGNLHQRYGTFPSVNTVNSWGDTTKIIYLSPQFAGFDFGVSFAPSNYEGPVGDTTTIANLQRLSGQPGNSTNRRNEVQAALRWRGSFGPVGLAATVGYIGADAIRNTTGLNPSRIDGIWTGAQVTAYGLTVGGLFQQTSYNGNTGTLAKGQADSRDLQAWSAGVAYTIDAITIGGNYARQTSAGSQTVAAARLDEVWYVGGNYRLAPGLDFFAEYNNGVAKERGINLTGNPNGPGITRGATTQIVLAGFRVAF